MEKIDARKLPPEALEHIRRQAFVLRKQGYTWTHIAEVCGVHVGTVLKWARRAQADDLDAVIKGGQRGRRHGSGRTLTLVQEEQLRLKIIGSNPAQLQLEFALWNRRAVMLAIKQLFGIDMPIRTVGEYLRRWGFTPQRPVKRALEQDPARLKAWLEDEYPKIVARTKTEDAEIIDVDPWRPAGSRSSGVSPAIDAERFIVFLKDLIQDAQRKVFLIVDNLRVHRANRVREWAAENTEKIELFYLPPYAPELNPDEYLNRDLKTSIRSGPIARTAAALLEKARTCMERIAAMPDRVRSYFSHEYVRYAQ